jgi:hypothetical protein
MALIARRMAFLLFSAAVQILPVLNQMLQYNTALCFLALGAARISLSSSRRLVVLAGGSVAALMGAAVILEYEGRPPSGSIRCSSRMGDFQRHLGAWRRPPP